MSASRDGGLLLRNLHGGESARSIVGAEPIRDVIGKMAVFLQRGVLVVSFEMDVGLAYRGGAELTTSVQAMRPRPQAMPRTTFVHRDMDLLPQSSRERVRGEREERFRNE
jgi:hypothetical protein